MAREIRGQSINKSFAERASRSQRTSDFFRELLALYVHVLDVHLTPRRGFPVVDARVNQVNVIPELLERFK